MNISGVLVRTFPDGISPVSAHLTKIPGVEVHGNNNDGRIVVTVKQEQPDQLAGTLSKMMSLPGVLATSMIYHQRKN
jgi:nitrate reductase NapD